MIYPSKKPKAPALFHLESSTNLFHPSVVSYRFLDSWATGFSWMVLGASKPNLKLCEHATKRTAVSLWAWMHWGTFEKT